MDSHAARVALLAEDLAEARPDLLEAAITRWVGLKPYLPKASEMIAIMQAIGEDRSAHAGRDDLEAQCQYLNDTLLARQLNRRYFVNYTVEEGQKRHFVDCREDRDTFGKLIWKPEPGEIEAMHDKVASYVSKGWTQQEFNEHVRRTNGNI